VSRMKKSTGTDIVIWSSFVVVYGYVACVIAVLLSRWLNYGL